MKDETSDVLKNNMGMFNTNKLEKRVLVSFSANAPSYRRVIEGLNLQATCRHPGCLAEGKDIYIPMGMGRFPIPREAYKALCPACHHNVPGDSIKNLGFWKCQYTIDGRQTAPEKKVVYKTEIAGSAQFTTFEAGDNATWAYLDVTTLPATNPNSGCQLL
jgi:hypothetical protein